MRDLVPYVVDNVIAHFLRALENRKKVEIAIHVEGQTVPSLYEIVDGLETALYGEDGWIFRFSKNGYDPLGIEK